MTHQCANCGVQTASPDLSSCPLCGGSWHDDDAILAKVMRRLLVKYKDYIIGTDAFYVENAWADLDPGDAEALRRQSEEAGARRPPREAPSAAGSATSGSPASKPYSATSCSTTA